MIGVPVIILSLTKDVKGLTSKEADEKNHADAEVFMKTMRGVSGCVQSGNCVIAKTLIKTI